MTLTAKTAAQIVAHLAGLTAAQLVEELAATARAMRVNDLVVEITPIGRFRVVREGNPAHGILADRHKLIGILVCLAAVVTVYGPDRFWKEVLS